MPQNTFAFWQAARGLVWSVGVVLARYALGSHIKNADHYLLPIIAVIIFVPHSNWCGTAACASRQPRACVTSTAAGCTLRAVPR